MNLPLVETGALVVAWSDEDRAKLAGIRDLAHRNGTTDARLVAADELFEREPQLARDARGAVLIPGRGRHRPLERAARLPHRRRSGTAPGSSPGPS